MKIQITEASPEAKAKIKNYDDDKGTFINDHHRTKYPFDELKIGYCFAISVDDAFEASLRITSSNHGKKTGKKFTVIKHKDYKLFEVARIA